MKYLLIARVKVQSDKIIGLGKILVTTKKLVIFLRFFFSNKVYHKTRNLLFSDVLEISKPVISTEECNMIIKGHKMSAKKWTGGVIHKVFLNIFQSSQKNSATFLQLVLQRYSSTNFGVKISEQLFHRTPFGSCFFRFVYIITICVRARVTKPST